MYGATKRYLEWYGIPRMYNTGLKSEEPRYTPRGYGDDVATILWKRCQDQVSFTILFFKHTYFNTYTKICNYRLAK